MKDGSTENVFIGERKMKKFSKKTIDTNWKRYNEAYDSSKYALSEKMSYNEFVETMKDLSNDPTFKRSKKSYAEGAIFQSRIMIKSEFDQYRQFAKMSNLPIGISLYSSREEIENYRRFIYNEGKSSDNPTAYWAMYKGIVA